MEEGEGAQGALSSLSLFHLFLPLPLSSISFSLSLTLKVSPLCKRIHRERT